MFKNLFAKKTKNESVPAKRVVVLGAGQVGVHITQRLFAENFDVILIDSNEDRINEAKNFADFSSIVGNGCNPEIYLEIKLNASDLFIAVTESDETNIVACNIANAFGCETKVARVREPFYKSYPGTPVDKNFWKNMGIEILFNQERMTTNEIIHLIDNPGARDAVMLHQDKMQLLAYTVKSNSLLCGRRLIGLRDVALFENLLVAAVTTTEGETRKTNHSGIRSKELHEKTIIPRGDYRIQENDLLYLCGKIEDFHADVGQIFNPDMIPDFKRIFILGGSLLAYQLANSLVEQYPQHKIHLIEKNRKRAFEAAEVLSTKIDIQMLDVHDISSLISEGLDNHSIYIGASDSEDDNVLACLMVKEETQARTISIVQNTTYMHLIPYLEIDVAVSPKLLLVDDVLRALHKNVYDVLSARGDDTEVLEFIVLQSSPLTGKHIFEIGLPTDSIVLAIIRGEEIVIPRGSTQLEANDHLIVFCLTSALTKVQSLFQGESS